MERQEEQRRENWLQGASSGQYEETIYPCGHEDVWQSKRRKSRYPTIEENQTRSLGSVYRRLFDAGYDFDPIYQQLVD